MLCKTILLSSILLGNILDSWSTYKGITMYNCVEVNPLSRLLMEHLGMCNYLSLHIVFTIPVVILCYVVWENSKVVRMLCVLWLIVEIATVCNNIMCLTQYMKGA